MLFASQAAAAIANARAHRDERRARADLEALVETSPVGVVVLHANTGSPLSLNQEAKRILGGLLDAAHPQVRLRIGRRARCHRRPKRGPRPPQTAKSGGSQ